MNHLHTLMIYSSQPADAEKVASWAWERLKLQKKPVVVDSLVNASHQGLLYFLTQELSPLEREAIASAKLRLPQLQLVLCASATFALDAWELDVFHFVPSPFTHQNLLKSYHKYIRAYAKGDTSLTVRYKDMKRIIASSNIMFVQGEGNYCRVFTNDGKSYILSEKLGEIEALLEGDPAIQRVGKSYLLNFASIEALGNGIIAFTAANGPVQVKVSERYLTAVRKAMKIAKS